jgi:hypothetical protein
MLALMSNETVTQLTSFAAGKKLAFLLLLYERMIPALFTFYLAEGLDLSVFQEAREEFWRALIQDQRISWARLRDDILNATFDSEDFGSLEALLALNAALLAGDIAGFLAEGQDGYLVDAMRYMLNTASAYVHEQMGVLAFDRSINKFVDAHPLICKERQKEEEDVLFLSRMPDTPWSESAVMMLRERAEVRGSLFDNLGASSQAGG